jgi:receptor protein-tyrosine kinase
LLESQATTNVLAELGRNFDYVIVDSPSMLVTDAAILAANSQGVLVIARYGQTKRPRLAQATNTLRRAGAPVLGAVITMTPARKRNAVEESYYGTAAQQDSPPPGGRRHRGPAKK